MRRTNSFFFLVMGAMIIAATSAHADPNIGDAAVARQEVSRTLSGASGRLSVGDPVFLDEIVHTGAESAAKLVFLDSTNLAIGAFSRVSLDRFVYDPSQTSQGLAVNLAMGVFRFTTGVLRKDAYSITTPTATIGVRGTVLDIWVRNRTRVTLVEGRALVCPKKKGTTFERQARDCEKPHSAQSRKAACDCVALEKAGQTAQVSSSGGVVHASLGASPVQFASFCSHDASLCSSESYASLNPGAPPTAPILATPAPSAAPGAPTGTATPGAPILVPAGLAAAGGAVLLPLVVSPQNSPVSP